MHKVAGVLPVLQTPYRDDESIDFGTLAGEIDFVLAQGADGVVLGMVSEILRLSTDERRELAHATCAAASGHAVVVGVGAESSRVAVDLARHAQDVGAAAVMAAPPVTVAAPQSELREYFRRIARAVSIPLVVQDASAYVGQPLSPTLQANLIDEFGPDRLLFKPEASPIVPCMQALLAATGGRARLFEGSGGIALAETFGLGLLGTMPGSEMVDAICALWRALAARNHALVDRLAPPIAALVQLQTGLDGFLAVEKHLLVRRAVFKNALVRGPVAFALDEPTILEVDRRFDDVLAALD